MSAPHFHGWNGFDSHKCVVLGQTLAGVIIVAPQGAGKSIHAERLREAFELSRVVDEWDGEQLLARGALVLTNCPTVNPTACVGYVLMDLEAALALLPILP